MPTKLVKAAEVIAAHGIKGEVKIRTYLEDPEALFSLGTLSDESGLRHFQLTRTGRQKDHMLARIEGAQTRNDAESLKGQALYTSHDRLGEAAEGEWFYHQLIGLEARFAGSEETPAKVVAMENYGAGDIIEIEYADGTREMLPFNDATVPEIEIERGFLTIDLPLVIGKE